MTQLLIFSHSNGKHMTMATNTREEEDLVCSKLSFKTELIFREHLVCARYWCRRFAQVVSTCTPLGPHFAKEKIESDRSRELPKVTQLIKI